jgi:hypothetical protein
MKSSITTAERLQLIGLLALAERFERQTHEVRDAIYDMFGVSAQERADITGHASGHIDDAVWDRGSRDVDLLIERLNVTVRRDEVSVPAEQRG